MRKSNEDEDEDKDGVGGWGEEAQARREERQKIGGRLAGRKVFTLENA